MKRKTFFILSLFLVGMFIPFINAGAVYTFTSITNPSANESFSFATTNEVFTVAVILTGLSVSTNYDLWYLWYIDAVFVDGGTDSNIMSSGAGSITGQTDQQTVDISTYSVGEHNVTVKLSYKKTGMGFFTDGDIDTHIWFRAVDPNLNPIITISSPSSDYQVHNRTTNGNDFTVTWQVEDTDGTIATMAIYFDGVLNNSYVTPSESTNINRVLTCNSDTVYTILINCTDDDGATASETIHIIALTGGTGYLTIIDPSNDKHSERISFTIQSNDADGLNNLSVLIDFDETVGLNQTDSFSSQVCNMTYDQLIVLAENYRAIGYSVDYSKVQLWVEDSQIDDSGDSYGAGYEAYTSSQGWNWTVAYGASLDRDDGSLIIWDDTVSSHAGVYSLDEDLYAYPYTDSEFFWETAITPNETVVHYHWISLFARLGTKYFHITLYGNDTLATGVTTGTADGTWLSLTQTTVSFTQGQQYIFRLVVGTSWVAYQYSIGSGFTTVRNSTSDYSSHYGNPYFAFVVVDNAVGHVDAFLFMDYFSSGWADWQTSTAGTVGLSTGTTPSLSTIHLGEDYYLNVTSTSTCRIWGTITTTRNISYCVTEWIYTTSALLEQANNWDIPNSNWTIIPSGDFVLQFRIGDDVGNILNYNRTYTKDLVAPIVSIRLPFNNSEWFVSEVPSLNYQINWGINDGDSTNELIYEINYNETNGLTVSWVISEIIPDRFPACDDKIVNSFGEYYIRIRAIDSAGNIAYSDIVYFTVYNERTMSISATSLYDALSINVQTYLRFYIDGVKYQYDQIVVTRDTFELEIQDVFGNTLYTNDVESYASIKQYVLPLRAFTFVNGVNRILGYKIISDDSQEALVGDITGDGSETHYLFDDEYTVIYACYEARIDDSNRYEQGSETFTSGVGNVNLMLSLVIEESESNTGGSNSEIMKAIMGVAIVSLIIIIISLWMFNRWTVKNLNEKVKKVIVENKPKIVNKEKPKSPNNYGMLTQKDQDYLKELEDKMI